MDHGVQLDHGEVQPGRGEAQRGHGKPRVHAPEDLVHGGKYPDHGGKLLGYDGEGQLDGDLDEVEDRGHYGAEPDDEVPETFAFEKKYFEIQVYILAQKVSGDLQMVPV